MVPVKTCGQPCAALRGKMAPFHLAFLRAEAEGRKAWLAAKEAGYKGGERALSARASEALARPDVQAALAYHRAPAAAKVQATLEDQVERLALRATATLGDFLRVRQVDPDPELLRMIADVEDPERRAAMVRSLQVVEVIPWDEIPREKLAALAEVRQTKDGAISFKLEPRAAADRQLAEMLGWLKHRHVLESPAEAERLLAELLPAVFREGEA